MPKGLPLKKIAAAAQCQQGCYRWEAVTVLDEHPPNLGTNMDMAAVSRREVLLTAHLGGHGILPAETSHLAID